MAARIQLSRRKGFDLQAVSRRWNGLPAKVVARPSKYGNPFRVVSGDVLLGDTRRCEWRVVYVPDGDEVAAFADKARAVQLAVKLYTDELESLRGEVWHAEMCLALRGYNLACWCAPGSPCHADVLLAEVA
jgi:hypothetical protein